MTQPNSCGHWMMEITKEYEQTSPVRCTNCNDYFALEEAIEHARTVNEKLKIQSVEQRVYIVIQYAMAILTEPRGWSYALPDLDIQVDGPKRDDIIKTLFELIQIKLVENALSGKQPPWPKSFQELKSLHPIYSDWSWEWAGMNVTNLLLPLPV